MEGAGLIQQMKMMRLCGSSKARLKSVDGSLFLLFSPFMALRRRLGASWPRSGTFFGAFTGLAILGCGTFKGLHIRCEIKVLILGFFP